ncbi:MAG: hypothetical protein K2Y17_09805 [Qipengyuania sp.]|nr:hypothetical protein [Qipengyuania sp.]
MAVDRTGDDRPAPEGRNEVAGGGGRFFWFRDAKPAWSAAEKNRPPPLREDGRASARQAFGEAAWAAVPCKKISLTG